MTRVCDRCGREILDDDERVEYAADGTVAAYTRVVGGIGLVNEDGTPVWVHVDCALYAPDLP